MENSMSDRDTAGFQYVSRRRRKKNAPVRALQDFMGLMESSQREIERAAYWMAFQETLQVVRDAVGEKTRILCLGLGSPHESEASRLQLVVLLQLAAVFGVGLSSIDVYDPRFTAEDMTELDKMGLRVLKEDLKGKHDVDAYTLVYMPHCDAWLFESLFRHNWSMPSLDRLVVLGNDLRRYSEVHVAEEFTRKWPAISRIVPYLEVSTLPAEMIATQAFAAMTFQVARLDKEPRRQEESVEFQGGRRSRNKHQTPQAPRPIMTPADDDFWVLPSEPL